MQIQIDLQHLLLDCEVQTSTDQSHSGAYYHLLAQIEPAFFRTLLAFTHSNKAHAARLAGIHYSTLERKLKQYGIVIHKKISIDSQEK
jgi:DNA-binding protein Fis